MRYSRPVLHKAKHKHYCTRFRFGSTTAAVPKTRGPIRRSREVGRRAGGRAGARERRRDRGGEAGEGQIRQNATRFGNSQSLGRHGLPFFPLQSVHVSMPDVPPWAVGRAGAVRFGFKRPPREITCLFLKYGAIAPRWRKRALWPRGVSRSDAVQPPIGLTALRKMKHVQPCTTSAFQIHNPRRKFRHRREVRPGSACLLARFFTRGERDGCEGTDVGPLTGFHAGAGGTGSQRAKQSIMMQWFDHGEPVQLAPA